MHYMPLQVRQIIRNSLATLMAAVILVGCGSTEEKPFVPPVYPSPPDPARFIYERTFISSQDVKEVTSADRFKMFATGVADSASGLGKPYGVAAREGRVYVSDTQQRGVLMFDVPGSRFKIIGVEGPGTLMKPLGMDIAPNGDLYVCDNTAKRIVVFNKDGDFLQVIGSQKELKRPSGVAVSSDGKLVYVVDTGGVDNNDHRVYIYESDTGNLVKWFGGRGTGPGEFNLPLQVATAKDGTVYVVDGGNFRVKAFDRDGNYKLAWGEVGKKYGNFSRPKGVAVDKGGNVYVADAAFGNVQLFNEKGELLMFIGTRGQGGGAGEFSLPAGVAVDEDGRIYMVDQYFRKVDVFRPASLTEEDGFLGTRMRDRVRAEQKAQGKTK